MDMKAASYEFFTKLLNSDGSQAEMLEGFQDALHNYMDEKLDPNNPHASLTSAKRAVTAIMERFLKALEDRKGFDF